MGILRIRALGSTVQEVIPSEETAVGRFFLCLSSLFVFTFEVYIPGPRRSDRFLRRTAPPCHKELCPLFSLTFLHSRS